ncbi:MAG: septal ring lytic transglycosylase RlpA family protein [Lewinellaceae bacterium]|nr:septal ring lytic transglycosylase RlpA family protein [Lewinellaceae bacterium]
MKIKITLSFLLSLSLAGLYAQSGGNRPETGIAVYYADDLHGQATSYGELYRREAFTAAHQHYPSGTMLRVTRLDNGQSVEVRVNDKMGADPERRIILSRAAAMQIGLVAAGKLQVQIERIDGGRLPAEYSAGQNNNYYPAGSRSGQLRARSPFEEPRSYGFEDARMRPESGGQNTYSAYAGQPAAASSGVVLNSGRALAPGLSGYVIQLASYDEGANAVSYVNQLLKQGLQHAYIWEKDGVNRVVIARFQDKASATDYLNELRRQYLLDGIVVQLK